MAEASDGNPERLPGLAVELVQIPVDVIVAAGAVAISAAPGKKNAARHPRAAASAAVIPEERAAPILPHTPFAPRARPKCAAFAMIIALPIGIYSAARQYSVGDYVATTLGFIGLAIPNFLLALILMYLGFRYLGLSVGGLFTPEYAQAPWSWGKFWDLMVHLPLPASVLALAGTAQLIRIMRANLLDELRKPYVVTARAKGISEFRAVLKYPVRAALNPFASSSAYLFPYLVSGSIVVSLVLGLPTVGPLLLQALVAQDMFLAGTIVLLLGVLTVIGTLISDLLLMWIEPRIRLQGRA